MHHRLLYGDSGAKLSRSDAAAGIRELREAGWTPERVLGHAAHLSGLHPRPTEIAAAELPRLFER